MGTILKYQPERANSKAENLDVDQRMAKYLESQSERANSKVESKRIICDPAHDFKQHVKYHDWFYHMSDDHRVYKAGDSSWNRLLEEASDLNKSLSPESKAGVKLFLRTWLQKQIKGTKDDWATLFLRSQITMLIRRIDGQITPIRHVGE